MKLKEFDDLIEEILDERSDRSLVILCSSVIDEQLYNILNSFFLNPRNNKDEDLLKGDNPLSTFSSRIKIIYRLGLVDSSFMDILNTIRKIRNECAHRVKVDLKKSPLKDHIKTLRDVLSIRKTFELTVQRYFENKINEKNEIKILFVTVCVLLKAISDTTVQLNKNQHTITISKK